MRSTAIVLIFCLMLSGCALPVLIWQEQTNTITAKHLDSSLVVKTALSQIGRPYKYGGSTPKGFDCSGLVWWSYRQNGINIPRKTLDQVNTGKEIPFRLAREGDILVFKISFSALHTGLYVGNGQFVHSPSSGRKVRLDQISNKYWSKRLFKVRRIR